eukprot:GSMAST32.ASY1.ANO1.329.1 assembled CDS
MIPFRIHVAYMGKYSKYFNVYQFNRSISSSRQVLSAKPLVSSTKQCEKDAAEEVTGAILRRLTPSLQSALKHIGVKHATPIQDQVIPRILSGEDVICSAPTGTGKTLAYLTPLMETLLERSRSGSLAQAKKPRALILVPTRELAQQVKKKRKKNGGQNKLYVASVLGGAKYKPQKIALSQRVDVVIATPARLLEHYEDGDVYFSNISHVVFDEADMLMDSEFGFSDELEKILKPIRIQAKRKRSAHHVQYIAAAATMGKPFIDKFSEILSRSNISFCSVKGLCMFYFFSIFYIIFFSYEILYLTIFFLKYFSK